MCALPYSESKVAQVSQQKSQGTPFTNRDWSIAGLSLPNINNTLSEYHYSLIEKKLEPLVDAQSDSGFLINAFKRGLITNSQLSGLFDPRYPRLGIEQSIHLATEKLGASFRFKNTVVNNKDAISASLKADHSNLQSLATYALVFEKFGVDISPLLLLLERKDTDGLINASDCLFTAFTELFNKLVSIACQQNFESVFELGGVRQDDVYTIMINMLGPWIIDMTSIERFTDDLYLKECVHRTLVEVSSNLVYFRLPNEYISEEHYFFEELLADYNTIIQRYGHTSLDKLCDSLIADSDIGLHVIDTSDCETLKQQIDIASTIKNGIPSWMQLPEDYHRTTNRSTTIIDRINLRRRIRPRWGGAVIDTCLEVLAQIRDMPSLSSIRYTEQDESYPIGDVCFVTTDDSYEGVIDEYLFYAQSCGTMICESSYDESNLHVLSPVACEKIAYTALGVGYVQRLQRQIAELGE